MINPGSGVSLVMLATVLTQVVVFVGIAWLSQFMARKVYGDHILGSLMRYRMGMQSFAEATFDMICTCVVWAILQGCLGIYAFVMVKVMYLWLSPHL